MGDYQKEIEAVAGILEKSENLLIFTGAGISTDSGIPDFRGPDGVWKTRQPVNYQDFMSSEASRVEYWEYKQEWWDNNRDAKPNAIHHAVAELEKNGKIGCVVTQNIDGLHMLAGTSPEKLVELHGTNWEVECQSCLERTEPGPHFDALKKTGKAPICHCGGFLKPATISFGQNLIADDMEKAHRAALEADAVVAMGSTLSVYPASAFPLEAAKRGAAYVIINLGKTDHDGIPEIRLKVDAPIGEVFPQAVRMAI